jgi:hypothetical protein
MKPLLPILALLLAACQSLPPAPAGYAYKTTFSLTFAGTVLPLGGSITPEWTQTATPTTQPGGGK